MWSHITQSSLFTHLTWLKCSSLILMFSPHFSETWIMISHVCLNVCVMCQCGSFIHSFLSCMPGLIYLFIFFFFLFCQKQRFEVSPLQGLHTLQAKMWKKHVHPPCLKPSRSSSVCNRTAQNKHIAGVTAKNDTEEEIQFLSTLKETEKSCCHWCRKKREIIANTNECSS